jgi:hypothetical protein
VRQSARRAWFCSWFLVAANGSKREEGAHLDFARIYLGEAAEQVAAQAQQHFFCGVLDVSCAGGQLQVGQQWARPSEGADKA